MLGKLYQPSHRLAPVYPFDLRLHLPELLGWTRTCSIVHAGLGFVILLPLLPNVWHMAQWQSLLPGVPSLLLFMWLASNVSGLGLYVTFVK